MTEKGYFDDNAFYEYAVHMCKFIPDDGLWHALILDGYGSHIMCFRILNYFVVHKVHVMCMPSHTSSLLQPLDVACFAPTKGRFKHDLHVVQLRIGAERYIKTFQTPAIF